MLRKIFAVLTGAALALTLGVGAANADSAGTIVTNADGSKTETVAGIPDAGGVKHTFKVTWGKKYKDPAGTIRVQAYDLKVIRSDAATEAGGEPADAGADVYFRVSSHGTVRWTQNKVYDGIDLDFSTDDQVTFNPRNPVSDVGDTFIQIKAGVDGDGLGNTRWVTFVQPVGLPGLV